MALQDYYNNISDRNATFSSYGVYWKAQTFTPAQDYSIGSVKLLLSRFSAESGGGDITVSIRETTSELPSGADKASGTTPVDTLPPLRFEWREITFDTPYALSSGVQYAIVFRALSAPADKKPQWGADTSSPTYSGGYVCLSTNSGGTWSKYGVGETSGDALFETYDYVIAEGTKTITGVGVVSLSTETYSTMTWPPEPPDIDPDKVWNEGTKEWVSVDGRGGSRYQSQLIVVSQGDDGNGVVYFGDL